MSIKGEKDPRGLYAQTMEVFYAPGKVVVCIAKR